MKKLLAILLTLVMLIPLFTVAAYADDIFTMECGDDLTMTVNRDAGTITVSGTGDMYSFEYYGASSWYYPWDGFNTDVTNIVFEEGITTISRRAFLGFTQVKSITFPESLKHIEKTAFSNCGLTEIYLGENIESIEKTSFAACINMKDVYFNGTNAQWYALDLKIEFPVDVTLHFLKETDETLKTEILISEIYCEHNYEISKQTPATCTKWGYTEYTCTKCSKSYKVYDESPKGHVPCPAWESVIQPTAADRGRAILKCSVCDHLLGEFYSPTWTGSYTPHSDVEVGSWYYKAVGWCVERGYMSGVSAKEFAPSNAITRAQLVLILAKLGEVELDNFDTAPEFSDVPENTWYSKAVVWATETGITGGTGEGLFSPNAPVTREQMATFLLKFEIKVKLGTADVEPIPDKYTDKENISVWAQEAMAWAYTNGFISGTSATTLSPKSPLTRAQFAVIAAAYQGRYVSNPTLLSSRGIIVRVPDVRIDKKETNRVTVELEFPGEVTDVKVEGTASNGYYSHEFVKESPTVYTCYTEFDFRENDALDVNLKFTIGNEIETITFHPSVINTKSPAER